MFRRRRSMFAILVLWAVMGAPFTVRGRQEPAWCPMHPDVRGAVSEKCKECGMTLVAIPDRTDRTFWLEVDADPAAVPAGRLVTLRLTVRDHGSNDAVSRFEAMHERVMHLFIVSSDLQYFDHVHPAPAENGTFEIPVTLPKSGAYRLVADVLPTGALPQTLQHTVLTSGFKESLRRVPPPPAAEILDATVEDVRARLVPGSARSGDDAHVVLELTDAKSGAAVTDLEPYLGAWGHMFLASTDLGDVVHSHPLVEQTDRGGPKITFQTLFAREGWYRVWTQVQRRGRLLTFGFTVRVAPSV
jgi:Heavy metal binding domain